MSGLEQAIRNALDRSDRANPDIRSRIYQSARNALDAGLAKQDVEDGEVIARQRQRLELTIQSIEDEERERVRSMARLEKVLIEREPEDDILDVTPDGDIPVAQEEAPAFTAERDERARRAAPIIEPELRTPSTLAEPEQVAPDDRGSLSDFAPSQGFEHSSDRRPGRKRAKGETLLAEQQRPAKRTKTEKTSRSKKRGGIGSLLVSLFIYAVFLGVLGFGAWWIDATGMLNVALKGEGNFDLVPKQLQGVAATTHPEPQALDPLRRFSDDWTNVFLGDKVDAIRARGNAVLTPFTDSDGPGIAIASATADENGEALITVPAAILQELAGKTSTIALTVKADSGQAAQIYVECDFGSLGACGRHRFTVPNERVDELMRISFEGHIAPAEDGHIIINSDLTGGGALVRLYGIRVHPGA